jgi:hypothetical protein
MGKESESVSKIDCTVLAYWMYEQIIASPPTKACQGRFMLSVALPAVLEAPGCVTTCGTAHHDLNYIVAFILGTAGVPIISQYREVLCPDVRLASVQRYLTFRTQNTAHLLTGLP